MQPMTALPFDAGIDAYEAQAATLHAAWRSEDADAIRLVHRRHPRFLDARTRWLPKRMSDAEIAATPFDIGDARLTIARWYDFADWASLAAHVAAVSEPGSPTAHFEAAVDAVVTGDAATLTALLASDPDVHRARSTRVTHFDPAVHRATLLHYIAANGVEEHRQKSPRNAVAIATTLLAAGAEPDALAGMYGGEAATMAMLVSSEHPAKSGVQIALIDVLVDHGASVEAVGSGTWTSPLMTALAFGFDDAAQALVRRGAEIAGVAAAAGLGDERLVLTLLPRATATDRQCALSLAAQHGRAGIVGLLLRAGADPNRHNPAGCHPHATPLHQAALRGHGDAVRVLVEEGGARLDIADTIYGETPLAWATHGGQTAVADYLRGRGG